MAESLDPVLLNRVIKEYGHYVVYIAGRGLGGPALLANAYLEGTYTELYPGGKPELLVACKEVVNPATDGAVLPIFVEGHDPAEMHRSKRGCATTDPRSSSIETENCIQTWLTSHRGVGGA